jgi:hypothetical protein
LIEQLREGLFYYPKITRATPALPPPTDNKVALRAILAHLSQRQIIM